MKKYRINIIKLFDCARYKFKILERIDYAQMLHVKRCERLKLNAKEFFSTKNY